MKNKKQILIIGSFLLAALLVWFMVKPTKNTEEEAEGKSLDSGLNYAAKMRRKLR